MKEFAPDFAALSKIEENLLTIKLDAARKAISHAGEKGRSLEAELINILRSFLPAEYGLSTGFIAYRTDTATLLTPQLDIIIYDAVRSGPLVRLATCDVFPLEAVYEYIEVKASLKSSPDDAKELAKNSIELCLKTNSELRKPRTRYFWAPVKGSSTKTQIVKAEWLALRGYVVAFSASGSVVSTPKKMAQRMANYSAHLGTGHLHGVLVAGRAFYSTRAAAAASSSNGAHKIDYTTTNPLAAFKASLLLGLNRFTRFPSDCTPAIDQYGKRQNWKTCVPERAS